MHYQKWCGMVCQWVSSTEIPSLCSYGLCDRYLCILIILYCVCVMWFVCMGAGSSLHWNHMPTHTDVDRDAVDFFFIILFKQTTQNVMYRNVRVLFDASSLQAIKPLWRGRQQLVKIRLLLFIHERRYCAPSQIPSHTSSVRHGELYACVLMTDTPRHWRRAERSNRMLSLSNC